MFENYLEYRREYRIDNILTVGTMRKLLASYTYAIFSFIELQIYEKGRAAASQSSRLLWGWQTWSPDLHRAIRDEQSQWDFWSIIRWWVLASRLPKLWGASQAQFHDLFFNSAATDFPHFLDHRHDRLFDEHADRSCLRFYLTCVKDYARQLPGTARVALYRQCSVDFHGSLVNH